MFLFFPYARSFGGCYVRRRVRESVCVCGCVSALRRDCVVFAKAHVSREQADAWNECVRVSVSECGVRTHMDPKPSVAVVMRGSV